ncbi:MAG: class I SAM-dependent methyltransferase [Rhodococcus sp. (in: high G+C Gram-positive bacteria)]|jgi:ubiquinone/menaquinone biosynthesis C-methylase UbiE
MDDVEASYADRAEEYVRVVGSMEVVHPSDKQLVTDWARSIGGPVLDVGCGPGQWTNHLLTHDVDVRGIDPTHAFVELARTTYPNCRFDDGRAEDLDAQSGSVAGILAWYSLIHHDPRDIRFAFEEFARVLRPGGKLLIGFFEATTLEPFDHAVITAYRWPVGALSAQLDAAGFTTVETHTRTGLEYRPHGAILAELTNADDNLRQQ